MRDSLLLAAQDESCVLCVTPYLGGSWWSRLRPPMPRNFSEGYQWNALQTAMYSSLPWKNDHHFTFNFTVAEDFENGSYWIMYQSNGRIVFSLDKDARGSRFVFGSYAFSNGVFVYTPFAASLAGRHEVILAVVGDTLRITVDGVSYEQSGERVESSSYNRVVTTSAPVTLHAVSLTDDSTETDIWQATYSDLYDTSNPWPSAVPRNFAEEPETWRDVPLITSAVGYDDCEFSIHYRLDGYLDGSTITQLFYHISHNGSVNIAFAGDGTGGNYSYIQLTDTDSLVIPLDRIRQLGEHTIRVRRIGSTVTIEFDDEVATTSSGMDKVAIYSMNAPTSNFNGVIFEMYWKNLTTGRIVWSYPTEAERVRLITKSNVRTDRSAFEPVDDNYVYYVDTKLDLRGYIGDLSMVANVHIDQESATRAANPVVQYHLITQGGPTTSNTLTVFAMYLTRYPDRSIGYKLLISDGSKWFEIEKIYSDVPLDQIRTVGVVLIKATREQRWFVNGSYIGSVFVPADWNAFNGSDNAVQNVRIGPHILSTSYWPTKLPSVLSACVFTRALSDAEMIAIHG